jgi:hypothetical protein
MQITGFSRAKELRLFRLQAVVTLVTVFALQGLMAQDRDTYEVRLEVDDSELTIVTPTNCGDRRLYSDLCIYKGKAATVQYSLVSEDWKLSELVIRDPAHNWMGELPEGAAAEFAPFDKNGVYTGLLTPNGAFIIQMENLSSLAVEYRVTAVNRHTGAKTKPAFSIIDSAGGAAQSGNQQQ